MRGHKLSPADKVRPIFIFPSFVRLPAKCAIPRFFEIEATVFYIKVLHISIINTCKNPTLRTIWRTVQPLPARSRTRWPSGPSRKYSTCETCPKSDPKFMRTEIRPCAPRRWRQTRAGYRETRKLSWLRRKTRLPVWGTPGFRTTRTFGCSMGPQRRRWTSRTYPRLRTATRWEWASECLRIGICITTVPSNNWIAIPISKRSK